MVGAVSDTMWWWGSMHNTRLDIYIYIDTRYEIRDIGEIEEERLKIYRGDRRHSMDIGETQKT